MKDVVIILKKRSVIGVAMFECELL